MKQNNIHSTAIVDPNAKIDASASIGPYCIIGPNVVIKANVKLQSHVIIEGNTVIDEGTLVYAFATIGMVPQDLKFNHEDSSVTIGKNTTIREHVTIHKGTKDGIMTTTIGNNCLLMVGVHVAHDVVLGDGVIMSNLVLLAGHVVVEDNVIISGASCVHQFCRLGEGSFIGGMSGITDDVVPYAMVSGVRAETEINGVNLVGLKRKGLDNESIKDIVETYKILFSKETLFKDNLETIKNKFNDNLYVNKIVAFIENANKRPLLNKFRTR